MRLLIGSTSPIMSSCNTVMSPCEASCHLCSRERSFPMPGWWGILHPWYPKSCTHGAGPIPPLTWARRPAAYLRFSIKVVSISPATAARSAPRGTRPAIRWILQPQRDQPKAPAPVSKQPVRSNTPSSADGKQGRAGGVGTEGRKRSHVPHRRHDRCPRAPGTQTRTMPLQ